MNCFENKVVVVTGSSMGIGKAVAIELLNRGAKVVINGRNATRLQATHEDLLLVSPNVSMFAADVSDAQALSLIHI